MNILVTGAKGFIGKNLVSSLILTKNYNVFEFDKQNTDEELFNFIHNCDFIVHLAGVNRPKKVEDFLTGNIDFTKKIINLVKKTSRKIPILMTSSIHASKNTEYGLSKKAAEDALFSYSAKSDNPVYIYRLPNVYGKWCKPNYNSVVATFCFNISHDLPINIESPEYELPLVYIDDVVDEIISIIRGKNISKIDGYCYVPFECKIKLLDLANLLFKFKDSRVNQMLPFMGNDMEKKLYSTFISYYDKNDFSYPLIMKNDNRGSFTEFLKTHDYGQVSINISKPGITKGNHWHRTKNEKFLVVSGEAIIRLRQIDQQEIIEYNVSGKNLEVVDIPPGYTHNISTIGNVDSVTIMWANELYSADFPDTFFLEV